MRNVLVLGGSGFVGRAVCERLVEHSGGDGLITVPTRRPARSRRLRCLPTIDLVQADVHAPQELGALVSGRDAVVDLVGILHGSAAAFEQVHAALPRALATACACAGVRRVVHVSAIGAAESAPSQYLRSKAAGEAALRASGLEVTLLRPSVVFGAEDRFMNLFASLQALAPVVPLAGGDARLQPVWVEDLAAAIVCCLERDDSIGQTFEIAGPRPYTLSDLVRLAGRWSGHERAQIALPMALGRLQAALFEILPGEPLLSRDNLASLGVPSVASGSLPGLAELGIEPTALEAVAPGYLGSTHGRARFDRLRAAARRG